MKQTLKVLLLALFLSPLIAGADQLLAREQASIFIDDKPYWKQTMVFPRWQDTYLVIFDEEMLA